jgi:hypothetical protein
MDDGGEKVYAARKENSREAAVEGTIYNTGTYFHIEGSAAERTVAGGAPPGAAGLAIIKNAKMSAADFVNDYSSMNGTFTKPDAALT